MTSSTYITIDGDDVGRAITACYIENNEEKLSHISLAMTRTVILISDLLKTEGFRVIFSAADGVAGCTPKADVDFVRLYRQIQALAPDGMTFSAGVGASMRDAYVALLYAKSSGKNTVVNLSSMRLAEPSQ